MERGRGTGVGGLRQTGVSFKCTYWQNLHGYCSSEDSVKSIMGSKVASEAVPRSKKASNSSNKKMLPENSSLTQPLTTYRFLSGQQFHADILCVTA